MSRYVDIDKPVIANVYDGATGQSAKMIVTIAGLLAGTIEVLEEDIVRCKDCKYHHYDYTDIPYCENFEYGYGWRDDDYCSYGKGKE